MPSASAAADLGSPRMLYWDPLRSDQRFRAILRRMNLPQ